MQILVLNILEQCQEVETKNGGDGRDLHVYGPTDDCITFFNGSNGGHMENAWYICAECASGIVYGYRDWGTIPGIRGQKDQRGTRQSVILGSGR